MNAHELNTRGWPCPTADEMRRADQHAIQALGLPGRLLMENAGRGIAAAMLGQFPEIRRPLFLCGSGNNGGDGFVVARVLRERDERIRPVVRVFGDRARMSEESRANLELLLRTGTEIAFGDEKGDLKFVVSHADAIVDAGFRAETVAWVVKAVDGNEYKRRQAAPGLKVTSKAFGMGRRMPIAARY